MCVCVCAEGGREGGGRGADTELKTKTPHVNVGKNGKLTVADGLVPMRFAIFPFHVSKVLRLPRKSESRSYEVLHL